MTLAEKRHLAGHLTTAAADWLARRVEVYGYDWKVIARGPNRSRTLCVDDKDLVEIDAASLAASGTSTEPGTVLA